jgi:hypothetical protein
LWFDGFFVSDFTLNLSNSAASYALTQSNQAEALVNLKLREKALAYSTGMLSL